MRHRRILGLFASLLGACAPVRKPVEAHTTVAELRDVFEEFVKSEKAMLVLTAVGTSKFIQFTGGRGGVEMDFPLVEPDQQAREPVIRAFLKKRGLNVIENRGTDGARFLDVLIPPNATELAEHTKLAFAEVFAIAGDAPVEVMGEGFSWPSTIAR